MYQFILRVHKVLALVLLLAPFALVAAEEETVSDAPAVIITYDHYEEADDMDEFDTVYAPHAAISDPFEGINRAIFSFNNMFDTVILEPAARGYRAVLPEYARDRVDSVLDTLYQPVNLFNTALQGDVEGSFVSFWRFVINATFGIGGLFDVASEAGLEPIRKDFGQTLARHGAGDGAYIVWPFIGPKTVRDSFGFVVDSVINPFNYLAPDVVMSRTATETVHSREQYLEITDEIERTSFDPYATVKSAYIQRRKNAIEE